MTRSKTLRIGNAGGYWGDDPLALKRQVEKGPLDYITMDFLAEVTMSILRKQQAKEPNLGYARDFIPMLEGVLPTLLKQGTRIITNAGGINPSACAEAIAGMAKRLGLKPRIAVVYGDDILDKVDALNAQGAKLDNMETGASFHTVKSRLEAANIYFGAAPVVEALRSWQPDIIITGRVTDTGITVAPMIFEFGWSLNDWDKIAAGIIAGHMLECGSQVTGGNFSDWHQVENYHNIGYPIAEVSPDGSFVLTKHPNTGGLVSVQTVKEQVFYEMGDPRAYITPDVVADFSTIKLEQDGPDRVRVFGIKGYEPTPFYKVSMAYNDGFKAVGAIIISGPEAVAKAKKFADIFWQRCPQNLSDKATEYVGWNACHRSLGHQPEAAEIMLHLGARSDSYDALHCFGKMIPSLILSGPPGVAVMGGVPKIQSVVSYWPALLPKELVHAKIGLYGEKGLEQVRVIPEVVRGDFTAATALVTKAHKPSLSVTQALAETGGGEEEGYGRLYDICLARSGDKGDSANIGVIARGPQAYAFLQGYLTAQRVKDWFQELCLGTVTRYEVEGLLGLNFLLEQSLGGGGSCTLRTDAQGKTFSQALLRQRIRIPAAVLAEAAASRAKPVSSGTPSH